jgi:hypothetical protein
MIKKLFMSMFLATVLLLPASTKAITFYDERDDYLDSCISSTNECYDYGDDIYEDDTPSYDGGSNLLKRYIRLTSPNGGEILGRNSNVLQTTLQPLDTHRVTWESLSYGINSVSVLYSLDLGANYIEVATQIPNAGFYDWNLPDLNADNVLVRVNAYGADGNNLGSDYSNAPFVLINYAPTQETYNTNPASYQAILVDQKSIAMPIHTGEEFVVDVVYYNNGDTNWYKFSDHPTMLGGYYPTDRNSSFVSYDWLADNRPAMLIEDIVVPGEVGTFRFAMKAPSTPGYYQEVFAPVVQGVTWMNTPVVFDITVI